MSTHTGTVTSVRFSPNGQYLASGSDDRVVIIWHKEEAIPGLGSTFGSGEKHTENWRSYRRLLGHDNDIQDLCWSYDSQLVVSVGLDSSIIVWNGTTFERLKRIEAHQSHVKGITFDPAGKYFATESDDRTIKVWRVSDFSIEKTITGPFNNSPLSTYFRRPSWSPDGKHIAAPNAMNGPVSCVSIIERGTWTSEINLIGHEGPVEVTAFNPKLFRDKNDKLVCILACGGQDRSLSIWSSALPRPLLSCQNVFQKSIGDVCWSPDGLSLFLCSYDGNVLVCTFEKEEFGDMVSDEEISKALAKYGHGRHGIVLPESAKQLELEETAYAILKKPSSLSTTDPTLVPQSSSTPKSAQKTPQKLPAFLPNRLTAETVDTNKLTASKEQIASPKRPGPSDNGNEIPTKFVQKVTITKEGKKRVAPQLLTTLSATPSTSRLASTQLQHTGSSQLPPQQFSQPINSLPKGGVPILIVGNKTKVNHENDESDQALQEEKIEEGLLKNYYSSLIDSSTSISNINFEAPRYKTNIVHSLNNEQKYVLEVKNGTSEKNPTRIVALENGNTKWMDYLPRPVILVTGSIHFWSIACDDGSLHLYSLTGSRLLPPIMIESKASFLHCNNAYLLCISSSGMVYAWNVVNKTALFTANSLAPILSRVSNNVTIENNSTDIPHVVIASISKEGVPSVTLSTGETYVYSSTMLCWQRITEPWWAIGSREWDSSGLLQSNTQTESQPLKIYEHRTNNVLMDSGRGKLLQKMVADAITEEGYDDFETIVTINHLENKIASARLLKLDDEFLVTSEVYVRLLMHHGLWQKLEEFLGELRTQTKCSIKLSGREVVAKMLVVLRQAVQTDNEFDRANKLIEKYAST